MHVDAAIYLTIPVMAIELILMVYVYSLEPQSWRNRTFALFMLLLALNSSARLVLSTTQIPELAVTAGWFNAVTSFMSGPMQWLLAIQVFASPSSRIRWWTVPLLFLLMVPLPVFLLDAAFNTRFIFNFSPALVENNFIPLRSYVQEGVGTILYRINVIFLNFTIGVLLLLLLILHSGMPKKLGRALIVLVAGSAITALITNPLREAVPHLSGIIEPLLVTLVTGWVIIRYHVLNPLPMELYRGLDRAHVGLIIFDYQGRTIEINRTACRMLLLACESMPCIDTEQDVVKQMMARAVKPERVQKGLGHISLQDIQSHQVEVLLHSARGERDDFPQHLFFHVEPILLADGQFFGTIYTIQDLTAERRVQAQLAETNDALQKQLRFIALLNDITYTANKTLNLQELHQMLADRLGKLFDADGCYVTLWDEEKQTTVPVASYGPMRQTYHTLQVKPGESTLTEAVLLKKRPLFVPDTASSPHISPRIAAMFPERSVLGLPLIVGEQKVGAVLISYHTPHQLDTYEIMRGEQVAAQIAIALVKTKLLQIEREGRKMADAIAQLSGTLRAATTLPEIFNATIEKGIEFVHGSGGGILLRTKNQDSFTIQAAFPPVPHLNTASIPPGVLQPVIDSKGLYESDHLPASLNLPYTHHPLTEAPCMTALPLHTQKGVIGVLLLCHARRENMLYEEVSDLLVTLAEIAGSAIQRTIVLNSLETEIQQRTQELAAANRRLAELDEIKSKLINDISHELRTPITNIRLYLDLMARGKSENHPRYLQVLQEKTESLIRLTEDILHISQLSLFQNRAVFNPADLNKIAARAFEEVHPQITERSLQLSFQPQPDAPLIVAAEDLLLQALRKIVDNALKYTPSGSIEIEVSASADRKHVYVNIADTGVGIYPDDMPYIFDRLYRGQSVGQLNIPGSGLGLTIAAEIITMHQGQIDVESNGKSGTIFKITLPAIA